MRIEQGRKIMTSNFLTFPVAPSKSSWGKKMEGSLSGEFQSFSAPKVELLDLREAPHGTWVEWQKMFVFADIGFPIRPGIKFEARIRQYKEFFPGFIEFKMPKNSSFPVFKETNNEELRNLVEDSLILKDDQYLKWWYHGGWQLKVFRSSEEGC